MRDNQPSLIHQLIDLSGRILSCRSIGRMGISLNSPANQLLRATDLSSSQLNYRKLKLSAWMLLGV